MGDLCAFRRKKFIGTNHPQPAAKSQAKTHQCASGILPERGSAWNGTELSARCREHVENHCSSRVITFVSVALTSVALLSVIAATRKFLNTSPARTLLPLIIADECPGLKKMACNFNSGAVAGAGAAGGAAGSGFATGAGVGIAATCAGDFVSGATGLVSAIRSCAARFCP